jgi:hypothetical protein
MRTLRPARKLRRPNAGGAQALVLGVGAGQEGLLAHREAVACEVEDHHVLGMRGVAQQVLVDRDPDRSGRRLLSQQHAHVVRIEHGRAVAAQEVGHRECVGLGVAQRRQRGIAVAVDADDERDHPRRPRGSSDHRLGGADCTVLVPSLDHDLVAPRAQCDRLVDADGARQEGQGGVLLAAHAPASGYVARDALSVDEQRPLRHRRVVLDDRIDGDLALPGVGGGDLRQRQQRDHGRRVPGRGDSRQGDAGVRAARGCAVSRQLPARRDAHVHPGPGHGRQDLAPGPDRVALAVGKVGVRELDQRVEGDRGAGLLPAASVDERERQAVDPAGEHSRNVLGEVELENAAPAGALLRGGDAAHTRLDAVAHATRGPRARLLRVAGAGPPGIEGFGKGLRRHPGARDEEGGEVDRDERALERRQDRGVQQAARITGEAAGDVHPHVVGDVGVMPHALVDSFHHAEPKIGVRHANRRHLDRGDSGIQVLLRAVAHALVELVAQQAARAERARENRDRARTCRGARRHGGGSGALRARVLSQGCVESGKRPERVPPRSGPGCSDPAAAALSLHVRALRGGNVTNLRRTRERDIRTFCRRWIRARYRGRRRSAGAAGVVRRDLLRDGFPGPAAQPSGRR